MPPEIETALLRSGPDRRITFGVGLIAALCASWEPTASIAAILGELLINGFIVLAIPFGIAKFSSKGKPFKGLLFLILTILAGVVLIAAKVTSRS